jgi:hypothetical protein
MRHFKGVAMSAEPQDKSAAKMPWLLKGSLIGVPALIIIQLLVVPVFQQDRGGRRSLCKNNLKQIGLALHNYHETHGSFPPVYFADENGLPIHSWRVLILPFLNEQALYDRYRFDQPWYGPDNWVLLAEMPQAYRCPTSAKSNQVADGFTNYLAPVGPRRAFQPGNAVSFGLITDGTSNTAMVVEDSRQPVPWIAPFDVTPEDYAAHLKSFSGANNYSHRGGQHVLLGDGTTRFIPANLDAKILSRLLTMERRWEHSETLPALARIKESPSPLRETRRSSGTVPASS